MTRLSDEAKSLIVRRLACYDTPKQVVDAVKEEFGIDVSRQQCAAYDPTKHAGRSLGEKWRVVFEETRRSFLVDAAQVPIAHMSVRLRRIERILVEAEKRGNAVLVLQALEQAAKEMGGAFTNKTRVEASGPNGAAIQHGVVTTAVPVSEYAKAVRQALDEF
ncbi:DUF2280 domain-containing protein [Burkholderia seminalis]|uniref:DUF2280 domain-containing protein n=2 Tax=Burkholderia cepacia complex TaxID=87882 RepID=A0A8A8D5F9_9BURK|nr:DUF2280 domain-containing protein [Burkholderia seminalis]QTO19912.1 DUF2280 domain-containing protein [Burkholderia seminalis]